MAPRENGQSAITDGLSQPDMDDLVECVTSGDNSEFRCGTAQLLHMEMKRMNRHTDILEPPHRPSDRGVDLTLACALSGRAPVRRAVSLERLIVDCSTVSPSAAHQANAAAAVQIHFSLSGQTPTRTDDGTSRVAGMSFVAGPCTPDGDELLVENVRVFANKALRGFVWVISGNFSSAEAVAACGVG